MKKNVLLLLAVFAVSTGLMANVELPHVFGDHMVLQRNKPIPIWGTAAAREKITVTFNGKSKTIRADKQGHWMVKLDSETAGGPYELTVKGKNEITFHDVLVGEVWLCSGQSNMEMALSSDWSGHILNYKEEIANAQYPQIRQLLVQKDISLKPKDDIKNTSWQPCSPQTAGDFTATGYFFARALYKALNIPIGIINSTWGGTIVETWTSKDAFANSDYFKSMIADLPAGDLESLTAERTKALRTKIEAAQGPLPTGPVTDQWKSPGFNDASWKQMTLPGAWENQGLPDVDGVVWFRKTVNVAAEDAGKPGVLHTGPADDSDDSYVNGTRVGGLVNKWSENRNYDIPAGVLKAGKNVIAIRVEDTGGGGGLGGNAKDYQLEIGAHSYPLSGVWSYRVEKLVAGGGVGANSYPTLLYNAMINPLIPYSIEGAIWYQGESNQDRAIEYRKAFPLMINDWRSRWGYDFPFYFVQLSSYKVYDGNSQNGGSNWGELRESQTKALSLPNTGMAVTIDIGMHDDIHPKNKQDVGKRLAAIALHNVYGEDIVYSGPMFQSMQVTGNKATLSFNYLGTGLMAKDKYGYLKGFEIAGADHVFHYAKAYIDGNKVVVYQDGVSNPVAVRYGWADDALESNLFNKEGFPASSFRTDDWKGKTDDVKYKIQ